MTQDPETFDESQKSTLDDKKVIINITFTGTDCNSSVTTDGSNTLDPEIESLVKLTKTRDSEVGEYDNLLGMIQVSFAAIISLIVTGIVLFCSPFEKTDKAFERPNEYIRCTLPDGSCTDHILTPMSIIISSECLHDGGKIDYLPCEPESFGFSSRSCILSDGTCMDLETERESNLCKESGMELVFASCKSIPKRSSCTYWGSQCHKSHCKQRLLCDETISEQECKELKGVFNTVSCPVK